MSAERAIILAGKLRGHQGRTVPLTAASKALVIRALEFYAEAGIAFFNTSGRISKSVIGPLYRAADATELSAKPHGWGVVMTNSLQGASQATVRREVTIADSLVTGYQAGGVLFDDSRGTDGNVTTQTRSGIVEYAPLGSCGRTEAGGFLDFCCNRTCMGLILLP